jgi:hypothetical protein
MGILRKILVFLILAVGALSISFSTANARAAEIKLQEQKIKAGLLYNFIKYSTWPRNAFIAAEEPFQICLLGGDAFEGALDPLQGRTAQQRPINIKQTGNSASLRGCHVVFINKNQQDNLNSILAAVKDTQTLTVSDIDGFSKQGGMVEFSKSAKNRIGLRLNKGAIDDSGLKVGDQLQKLAGER